MIPLKKRLREDLFARLGDRYPLKEADIEFGYPPRPEFGDLSVTFPFKLARELKTNPRRLAGEMLEHLSVIEGVARAEIAGPGYINFFLDRQLFFRAALAALAASRPAPEEKKIIIEHTNINPNKAAHIGHLRNACLGDTLARCLRHKGENVEVQNYIDDTGVQVVDVVFGFMDLEKKGLADLEAVPGRFDYYCWDLYARTSSYLASHSEALERRAAILKKIEHGEGEEAAIGQAVSRRIVGAHLETMKRIGIAYDLLPCESSILGLKFWEKAFTLLKERGAISLAAAGVNAGCWVMMFAEGEEKEKVIVRSDGTVTYVGKDIAYQLWKFGLLGRDFYYEPFLEEGGKTLWISSTVPNSRPLAFGGASTVYNVIDSRQAYLQKIVAQGLSSLGFEGQAGRSIHFAYEMVALSPKSLKELGYDVRAEEKDRSFLEVSGRKGLGVKADDLLDRLEAKALAEVGKRHPDLASGVRADISRAIACGALRYFMLKFARNSIIVFDFEEALSFEGETGPYLQYTRVRLSSIFRKLAEREGAGEDEVLRLVESADLSTAGLTEREAADFWDLVTFAAQFEEHVLDSVYSLEFSHLAKFAFILCQKTNAYYHLYSILNENHAGLKRLRIAAVLYVREILDRTLGLMGIPQPEKM